MPPVLPLSEIPTLSLLYKIGRLSPSAAPAASLPRPSTAYNDLISLVRTDITTLRVSAIVNAANTSLRGGGGVDGAIHAKAGPALLAECKALGGCATGSAKITAAHRLPCDKVIHAVGPLYLGEDGGRARGLLASCYRASLDLATEHGCASVAFSCLSTGVYGYPSRKAAEVALAEVRRWLDARPTATTTTASLTRIIFCCFEPKDVAAYEDLLPQFFPPADASTSKAATVEHEALVTTLPDPPAHEPVNQDEPSAKKVKMSDDADDWEAVERPEGSAVNGVGERIDDEEAEIV